MVKRSDSMTMRLLGLLQDDTRLAIYIQFLVYTKRTLKELSDNLGKGKTTIHHHIRKFEEEGLLIWDEEKEDKKTLKTRHYSISNDLHKNLGTKESLIGMIRIEALITNYLTELLIKYIEKQPTIKNLNFENFEQPSFMKIPFRGEIPSDYKQAIKEISRIYTGTKTSENIETNSSTITHFGLHSFIPIKKLLEWNQSSFED